MKLAKSLLLASAAGFAAFGAQAADLPSKKAAPVEYVKVCPQYGAGFFVVPGTDGCLRVGGRVRADYVTGNDNGSGYEPIARADHMSNTRVRGYIYVDHRQQTELGLVRSFARLSSNSDAGTGADFFELAFMQIGGFTFGQFTNPYEILYYTNGWAPLGLNGIGVKDSTADQGIAYTHSFGGGVTGTVAVMNGAENRANGGASTATTGLNSVTYAGHNVPDFVAAVEAVQGWGSVKLSGVLHQVRHTNSALDTDYGYGVNGGVKINLPMIAAGDFLSLQGAYTEGAPLFAGAGQLRAGQNTLISYDATAAGKLSTAWSVAGGLTHFWTKTVDTHVYGGYVNFENGADKARQYTVSQYTKWTPVAGLQIGVETGYRQISGRGVDLVTATSKASDKEDFFGRLRVQRDF